jgi:predicted nucleotidyltransferase
MNKKRAAPAPYVQPYRYPSPNIPLSAIRRFARQIAERFHPEKIILFGSYAYGTPHAESDVDLLVIMPAYDAVNQAIRICMAFEPWPFVLDVIVRTPQQLERGLRQNNWFLREVVEKGKVLYDARNDPVGSVRRGGLGSGNRGRRTKAASPKRGVLPLPAGGRKVPQGAATRTGSRRAKNTLSELSPRPTRAP